jgi:hypothetical protein
MGYGNKEVVSMARIMNSTNSYHFRLVIEFKQFLM